MRAPQHAFVESDVYPLRIGPAEEPWCDNVDIPDPFGNRLVFTTPRPSGVERDGTH